MKKSIDYIAYKLSQNKIARFFFRPLWQLIIVKPKLAIRRRRFLNNGLDLLDVFDKILCQNNIKYSLVFGTLLGAVREKGFISHDLDIDVAIFDYKQSMKIQKILENNGFQLYRRIEIDEGTFGLEETYIYRDVSIDLFYFYPYDNHYKYCNVFIPHDGCSSLEMSMDRKGNVLPLQLILPINRELTYIPFYNLYLPIPTNAQEFLEARYGKNWRIPDPTFVYPKMGDVNYKYLHTKKGIISFLRQDVKLLVVKKGHSPKAL